MSSTTNNASSANGADDNERNAKSSVSASLMIGLLASIAIILIVYYSTKPNKPKKHVSEGLQKNGWLLYTRPGCGFCDKQKALLGNKFLNTPGNVIDCGSSASSRVLQDRGDPAPAPLCGDPRIVGYPFWYCKSTAEIRVGLQDASQLRGMAAGARSS